MKLYIKNFSTYRSDEENLDIKKELKQKYKQDTRRKDAFIHLAILGAQRLNDKVSIDLNSELYITSGVGNVDVLQRVDEHVLREGQCIKPFDFINMLGNTTNYYVASSLGLKGKNIFQISDNFTFINSLISIYASANNSKKDVVFGSVDLLSEPEDFMKRVLGVEKSMDVISAVNYQYLSINKENALAELLFDTKVYDLNEVKSYLSKIDSKIFISKRCLNLDALKDSSFFETFPSWLINDSILKSEDMIFVDCIENKYKILELKIVI